MNSRIFLVDERGELIAMDEQSYDAESRLQMLLIKHPDLMDGSQVAPVNPRRWLLVQREAPSPVDEGIGRQFSLDHLFLDQDGVPTLVEVKRASDTRIRREVIGQMLDYAASIAAHWSADQMRFAFEQRCEHEESEPEIILQEAFGEEQDYDAFWGQVKTNLLAKRLRLLFVADQIPAQLRRIIEFLNETMDPVEVLGVEIPQYIGGNQQALVPRVIGQTSDAAQRKQTSPRSQTDRDTFLDTWDASGREFFVTLLDYADERGFVVNWGTKGFSLNIPVAGQNTSIFQGYPSDKFQGNLIPLTPIIAKLRDGEQIADRYAQALLAIGVASKVSEASLRLDMSRMGQAETDQYLELVDELATQMTEHGLAER